MSFPNFFEDHSDEDLIREFQNCCNPNCAAIAEMVKRYKEVKERLQEYKDRGY